MNAQRLPRRVLRGGPIPKAIRTLSSPTRMKFEDCGVSIESSDYFPTLMRRCPGGAIL